MTRRRAIGGLEAEILAVLWASTSPLSVAAVTSALGDDLAYTTVQTTLGRLHTKGAVERELSGRAYVYTAVLDDAGLAARKMRAMLDRGDDQFSVLRRFVGTLTPGEGAALSDLLAARRSEPGGRAPEPGR